MDPGNLLHPNISVAGRSLSNLYQGDTIGIGRTPPVRAIISAKRGVMISERINWRPDGMACAAGTAKCRRGKLRPKVSGFPATCREFGCGRIAKRLQQKPDIAVAGIVRIFAQQQRSRTRKRIGHGISGPVHGGLTPAAHSLAYESICSLASEEHTCSRNPLSSPWQPILPGRTTQSQLSFASAAVNG